MLKDYVKALEKHKSNFSAKKEKIDKAPVEVDIEQSKPFVMKFPDNKEGTIALIKKTEDKIIRE